MRITGDGYNVVVNIITNPRCHMRGWYVRGRINGLELDSIWCGVRLDTFEQADNAVLEIIRDEFRRQA
ncbi:MAG: hypothetical protein IKE20_07660 [Eggerthellaceae bacterium]|nr:hypothetical protein [Eggerthellaceae bacterium]